MGATELLFIFGIYLLLFGAKGIPSLAKSMGQAVRTFRNATEDIQREILTDKPAERNDFSHVREVKKEKESTPTDQAHVADGPLNDDPPS